MSKIDRECASRSVRKELVEKLGVWVLLGTEGGVLSQKMVPGSSQRSMEGDVGDGKGRSCLGQHSRSQAADLGRER